jgi:hypothetical protein
MLAVCGEGDKQLADQHPVSFKAVSNATEAVVVTFVVLRGLGYVGRRLQQLYAPLPDFGFGPNALRAHADLFGCRGGQGRARSDASFCDLRVTPGRTGCWIARLRRDRHRGIEALLQRYVLTPTLLVEAPHCRPVDMHLTGG